MADITLIVPPIVQTQLTGFRLAAEKTIRRAVWRVEYWSGETLPRISRDGLPVSADNCPRAAIQFANAITRNYLKEPRQ